MQKNDRSFFVRIFAVMLAAVFLTVGFVFNTAETVSAFSSEKTAIQNADKILLYPGGMPFGVRLNTKGVIVVGISDVETEKGSLEPATDSGLQIGDVIEEIDGKKVNTTNEVSEMISSSEGKKLSLSVNRDGETVILTLTPVYSSLDKAYKAGIWIRDSTAGIGTVTYIDPKTLEFGGLGHGICDVDTGEIMPLLRGTVMEVTLNGVTKGIEGTPGELRGFFGKNKTGTLIGNTPCGVYGFFVSLPDVSHSEQVHIALKDEITTGKAFIYSSVGNKLEKYSAEITKINYGNTDQKNFVIKITDKRLLDTTGGIVQGMSGSPVIQNGKLVGAVTHVLVNDPKKGYGIFIENMLKNSPQ